MASPFPSLSPTPQILLSFISRALGWMEQAHFTSPFFSRWDNSLLFPAKSCRAGTWWICSVDSIGIRVVGSSPGYIYWFFSFLFSLLLQCMMMALLRKHMSVDFPTPSPFLLSYFPHGAQSIWSSVSPSRLFLHTAHSCMTVAANDLQMMVKHLCISGWMVREHLWNGS